MRHPEKSLLLGVIVAALLVKAAAASTCAGPDAQFPFCSDPGCDPTCYPPANCLCSDGSVCLPDATVNCGADGCCPSAYTWDPVQQCCEEELTTTEATTTAPAPTCSPACNFDEACAIVNGAAQCTCNKTYYGHLNSSDITPTVTCLPQVNQTYQVAHMSFSKCKLEILHYDYTRWHPLNSSAACTGGYTVETVGGVSQVIFEPLTLTEWCGNVMTVMSDKVSFLNALYIPPDNKSGIIYGNALNFSYSCIYNLTMQTSLTTVLHPVLTTVNVPLGNGLGSVNVTMAAYLSNSYTDPLTADTTLIVGTPFYVGIMADSVDGSIFALRAERCVASPTNIATDPNAVVLIDGGCAVNQDVNTQVLNNGDALEVRFSLDTFQFQSQLNLYLFCDVRMCQLSAGSCTGCSSGTRDAASAAVSPIGPLNIQLEYNAGSHKAVSWAVLGSSLLALLTLRLM